MLFKTHILVYLPIQNSLQSTIQKLLGQDTRYQVFELILPQFIFTGGLLPVFIYLFIYLYNECWSLYNANTKALYPALP